MIRITDKNFKYTPSFATDLKKRFRKKELARQKALKAAKPNVTPIRKSK